MKRNKTAFLLVAVMLFAVLCPALAFADDDVPLLNLQLYFIDKDSYALPGYIVTIDNERQSVTNGSGIASFPAVDARGNDTFKLYSADGKTVLSICNLSYVKADQSGVGPEEKTGNFVVYYSTPNATLYIVMVADPGGNSNTLMHPAKVSDTPPDPGKKRPAPSPTPSANPSAKPTSTPAPTTNPSMEGYLVDTSGKVMPGVTVESRNDKSGKSLSAISDKDGYYYIPGLTAGMHTVRVYTDDSTELGKVKLYVEAGETTEYLDVDGDGLLDIRTGLKKLYANFQVDAKADSMAVLEVSDEPLSSPESGIKATGLKLNANHIEIDEGESFTLKAKVLPRDAAIRTVKWTSSDEAVAKVDGHGNVTALKAGKATITAATTDGTNKTDACEVTVVKE